KHLFQRVKRRAKVETKSKRLTIPTYSSAGSFGKLPDGRELLSGEGVHATRNSGTMILIIRRRKMALTTINHKTRSKRIINNVFPLKRFPKTSQTEISRMTD